MTHDWPHQVFAVSEAKRLIALGKRRITITSPTGGGKSRIVHRFVDWGRSMLILTNRTMLAEQWARGLDENGFPFDMRASGYAPTTFENTTIGMVQTVARRWE